MAYERRGASIERSTHRIERIRSAIERLTNHIERIRAPIERLLPFIERTRTAAQIKYLCTEKIGPPKLKTQKRGWDKTHL